MNYKKAAASAQPLLHTNQKARLRLRLDNSQNYDTNRHYQKNGSIQNRADSLRGTSRCAAAGNGSLACEPCSHFLFLLLEIFMNESWVYCISQKDICQREKHHRFHRRVFVFFVHNVQMYTKV